MAEKFSNKAQTTLNGAINNSTTSVTVTSAANFPATGNFRILVKAEGGNTDEIMTVTSVSSNTFTVTRASETVGGTSSASAHSDGATVKQVITAGVMDTLSAAVIDYTENTTSQALSASGTVVTRTVTLAAGTYVMIGHVRTSAMTSAGNPGHCYLRKASTQITGTDKDLRPTAAAQFVLQGYFTHTGGSVTIDIFFVREAGTTTFGVVGSTESRFCNSILVYRIGD